MLVHKNHPPFDLNISEMTDWYYLDFTDMQRRHEEGDVARLARIRNTIREVRGAGNASASAPAPAATGGIVAANTATPSQSPPYQNGHGQFVHHHHPSSWSSNAPATSTFQHGVYLVALLY